MPAKHQFTLLLVVNRPLLCFLLILTMPFAVQAPKASVLAKTMAPSSSLATGKKYNLYVGNLTWVCACLLIFFPGVESRERTIIGSVSVSEPILGVSYRISATVVSARPGPDIRASMQVHQLTDCITQDDQRAFKLPVTRPLRAVLWSTIWERVGGGGRRKETVSRRGWYRVTKTAQYWS